MTEYVIAVLLATLCDPLALLAGCVLAAGLVELGLCLLALEEVLRRGG